MMKAIIRNGSGKEFSNILVKDIPSPTPVDSEIKIRMVSSRINPVDMDLMKKFPFVKYKDVQIAGVDGAGIVTEVGPNAKKFKSGDAVFFYRLFTDIGAWAQEICIREEFAALIPQNISVEQAGAIALPLLTAYDSIKQLNAKPGDSVLIHAAAGGVGLQAVQIAKKLNLKVYANAGGNDIPMLKNMGVEETINYKTEKFGEKIKRNEVNNILDFVGGETLIESINLAPKNVVSVRFVQPENFYKVGMSVPKAIQWIIRLTMRKTMSLAKKNNVNLIGQTTGGNGALLAEAAKFIENIKPYVTKYSTITLEQIQKKGLSKSDIGKVILLN